MKSKAKSENVYKIGRNSWAYTYEGQVVDGFTNKEFACRAYNKAAIEGCKLNNKE